MKRSEALVKLGFAEKATPTEAEIKKAYRRLALSGILIRIQVLIRQKNLK